MTYKCKYCEDGRLVRKEDIRDLGYVWGTSTTVSDHICPRCHTVRRMRNIGDPNKYRNKDVLKYKWFTEDLKLIKNPNKSDVKWIGGLK